MDTPRTHSDVDLTPLGGDGPQSESSPQHYDEVLLVENERVRDRLWSAAGAVYRGRWVIGLATVLAAAASIYLTLQLPNQYRAETRVLLPEGGDGLIAGAISSISPTAAALLGGGGGGFTRYMAILNSPSTLGTVVDRFNLIDRYDLSEEPHPREAAISELYERASFDVNLEYDYLGVSVLDEDPENAAQMANYFVELLNTRNVQLTSESASSYRVFLEQRLNQANAELDSAQAEMQALQERSGVIEPTSQADALMASMAAAQSQIAIAEAQYQALLSQYGSENPDVQAALAVVTAARRQSTRLSDGDEAVMPIPLSQLPSVQRQYQSAMQELLIQKQIIETIQPLYEQAALQEQRDADAVQVLDPATPPTRKAEPRRSVLVIAATLSGFLLALFLVLAVFLTRRTAPDVLARVRAEVA